MSDVDYRLLQSAHLNYGEVDLKISIHGCFVCSVMLSQELLE